MSEERRLRAMEVRRLWSIYQEGRSDGIKTERGRILKILDTLPIREPTHEELMELELSGGPLEHAGQAWAWYRDEDLKDAIEETDDDT